MAESAVSAYVLTKGKQNLAKKIAGKLEGYEDANYEVEEASKVIQKRAYPTGRFSPVIDVVEDIDFHVNAKRIRTRIPELDRLLRGGYGPGLHFISANQSQGKTEFVLNMIARNKGKRIIYLTSDDTRQEVLQRLWLIGSGKVMPDTFDYDDINAEYDDEADISEMREGIIDMIQEYGNGLVVVDGSFTYGDVEAVYNKMDKEGGVDLVVFDYLDMLTEAPRGQGTEHGKGFGSGTHEKIRAFKTLSIEHPHSPWLIMHQANKSTDGEKGFNSWNMASGGHAEARTITGLQRVYTTRGFEDECPSEAAFYKDHPTVNVVFSKNKQSGKTNAPYGIELSLHHGLLNTRTWSDSYKRKWIKDWEQAKADEDASNKPVVSISPGAFLGGSHWQDKD